MLVERGWERRGARVEVRWEMEVVRVETWSSMSVASMMVRKGEDVLVQVDVCLEVEG